MRRQENSTTLDYKRSGGDINMIFTYFLMKFVCNYTTVLGCTTVFIEFTEQRVTV